MSVSTTVETKIPLLTRPPLSSYKPEIANNPVITAPPIAMASVVGILVLAKNSIVESPKYIAPFLRDITLASSDDCIPHCFSMDALENKKPNPKPNVAIAAIKAIVVNVIMLILKLITNRWCLFDVFFFFQLSYHEFCHIS